MTQLATSSRRRKSTTPAKPANDPAPVTEALPIIKVPAASAPARVSPSAALLALRQRVLDTAHQPLYSTRRQQLQTVLTTLDSLARKIPKSDQTQQAALSVLYELLLIIAERFELLVHGVVELSAMNRASSLHAIREARKRYRDDFYQHQAQCGHLDVDAPQILRLLAELARESL